MGRGNRFNSGGGIFQVTHRCHNRAFLLQFGPMIRSRRETEVIQTGKESAYYRSPRHLTGRKQDRKTPAKRLVTSRDWQIRKRGPQ
jgi:hypothetical protein